MKIGIIGLGNMGSAIYTQLTASMSADLIYVCGHHPNRAKKMGVVNFFDDVSDLVQAVDVVILAIKPQSFHNLLDMPDMSDKLVISVMAGVNLKILQKQTKSKTIVRAMPNLGVKVGEGVIGWIVNGGDKEKIKQILNYLGTEIEVEKEDMIDSITALSGSGPAYFYYLTELMAEKAEEMGFSKEQANMIAEQTFVGSAKLLSANGKNSGELRQAVASKGGTTEAALKILTKGKFKEIFFKAIKQAVKKSNELSK